MSESGQPEQPDFAKGVALSALDEGVPLRGSIDGAAAIMVRKGADVFVVGAECTHYHGPLAEGLTVGETVRCPWHHACFSLRTGEAIRAPAFDSLPRWRVEEVDGKIFARERLAAPMAKPAPTRAPKKIVIVGAGAAGFAAAHRLRAEGYDGALEMIGADLLAPYDRPNLSKDYLAGSAPPEWLPLREPAWYHDNGVVLHLGRQATALDVSQKLLTLGDGSSVGFDALLLATGADPVRLPIPGADRPNVFYLRQLADADRIAAACGGASRAAVVGASFIGLEVAASLRTRGLAVDVIAPEAVPMARILGPELGAHIQRLHESHGVVFHLEDTVTEIGDGALTLKSGAAVAADFVVIGIGVRPNLSLAERAGLAVDKGVLVDEYLATSAPGVYAAGDIARWPDRITGERIRVEHWVVAERQGQTAARNILGFNERFDAAPFFWSQHYDQTISYVGHAPQWDRCEVSGDPASGDCAVAYWQGARKLAVATLGRDIESLRVEVAFEKALG
ncbi:FAD-dependent oxidoreductase [Methylocystis sp. JR02]|uniref:FAD-dependent oxidoreductase n=1 Tax=Methylocystis sp. JR02 TaxID=3046284 RepID=UPI0024B9ECC9|nr:FAD-dependent oxidoreductase [Methylocystis sp. JR02]MDJ0448703.1 FAD-dependent oxidoreductase [Methylocystis sp. JR02]